MAIETHREVEQKYDADPSTVLPAWTSLAIVQGVDAPVEMDLTAIYFDTADLALSRAGITLRRRTGGVDDGWHLKLPVRADERLEMRGPLGADLGDGSAPDELAEIVQGCLRGRSCVPIATLQTHRVVHRIRDSDGELVAEVCDDNVTADVHDPDGSVSTHRWREWEVDGADIPRPLALAIEQAMMAASARPMPGTSKLGRALGSRLPHPNDAVERQPAKDAPAGAVLLAYLRAQVAELQSRDPQVRADQPDAVHKMRVAIRRLRSALETFKPMVARDVAISLRGELKWLAGVLSEARDAEVMRDRLAGLAAQEPSELGSDGVADLLEDRLQHRYDEGLAHVRQVLLSPRYFRLLDSLDALTAVPPWTDRAQAPGRRFLRKRVHREWKRLKAQANAAKHAQTAADLDEQLHEVRKTAKRLRYACEAIAPVFGPPAADLAEAAANLQETLGDHHDSVVSQQLLRDLASHTTLAGDDVLIYGRLHLLEQTHAERARARHKSALKQVHARCPKRWRKA